MVIHFVVNNWITIMLIAIAVLNIIAAIAILFDLRAIDSVLSSRSSRMDAGLAASQEEARA